MARSNTYDHRIWRTPGPVRSPVAKPDTARLVVGSVTTSESLVLYVFCLATNHVKFPTRVSARVGFLGTSSSWRRYIGPRLTDAGSDTEPYFTTVLVSFVRFSVFRHLDTPHAHAFMAAHLAGEAQRGPALPRHLTPVLSFLTPSLHLSNSRDSLAFGE
ncbi:hypothetical protein F4824DRAFT_67109 [Ustulina deusta]|nr:hypothetical protein F4824DRAFT_67109 [Ustulina deusta]